MKLKLTFLFLAAIAIGLSSCKKDESKKAEWTIEELAPYMQGLGDKGGTPTGTEFNLPAGITIDGEIRGGYDNVASAGFRKEDGLPLFLIPDFTRASSSDYIKYGSGTYVEIFVKIKNSNSSDAVLDIPAGLIFVCVSGSCQNGFILQKISIPLPANKITYARIKSYCLNLGRDASYNSEKYILGRITNHPLLLQIVGIMRDKNVPTGDAVEYIQDIIWDVTEYNGDYVGLTREHRNYLNSLP